MPKRPNAAHLRAVRAILDEPIRPVTDGPKPRSESNHQRFVPSWLRQGGVPGREIILSGANANSHVVRVDKAVPQDVGCTVKTLEYVSFGKETSAPPPHNVTF